MKKIICTIALMLQLVCLSAQINRPVSTEIYKDEYFILNSGYGQPISYEFYAGDSIILDEGFFRNYSNGQYYFTMDLVVDDIGVYPPTAGTQGGPSEGDNGYVGALDGTFDVGMMGGAAYTIPIDLPSGINGMQPSLALCYNSQGGNGLLGWKWDLAGLSSVTRTGRTLYHDGVIGGVTLSDDTDRFQLDGQRLMPVHDYTDSVDYKTEQDGLARIRAYWENDTIGNGRHIKNFKVWDPDGTILEYGFTIDSRIDPQNGGEKALCWLLNKTTDRQGNSVLYHYTELQETGEYYIHSIEYTCNDLLFIKPKYHIIFNYTDRSDYEFSYVKGNTIQNKRLLSSIVVTDNEETVLQCHTLNYSDVWEYAAYDYSKNKMYHRLLSVEFEKGGMKLNPTKITWEYDENNVYQHNVCNKIPLDTTYLNNFVFVGDFNADGFSDVITVPYKDDSVYSHPVDMNVLLNTGNGEFQYSPALSMNTNNGHPLATNLDWIHVIDINDDGYDDIIIQYYTYLGNNLGSSSLMLYLNYDGVMFYPAWASPIVAPQRLYLTLGDYLGNGRQNALACVFLDNFSTIPLLAPLFYIHNENGTSTCDTIFNPHVRLANDLVSGDFDGDGHTEIMIVDTLGAKMYRLRQSGSNLLFEEKQYGSEIIYDSALNMFPGDYNGDGKEDLLCYGKKNASDELSWFFLMSSGVDFRCKATHVFEGLNFAPREKMYTYSLEKVTNSLGFAVFVSDFDGDGCCDIALSRDFPYNNSLCIYSKFVKSTMVVISGAPDYNTIYHNTFNPLAKINAGSLNTRSQYIHAGNFFSKDNLSILGNEVTSKSSVRKPVLCDIYSLHEYNSVTCITDGMGTPLRMSYAYPAVAGVNQINFENGIARLNVPVRTLKSVTSYKTNDAELTTTYSFSNAMLHKNGHGYLGFLKQEATNTINGVNVSKRISLFETLTMGAYAFSLPMQETTCIFKDNEGWLTSTKTDFEFRRVVSTRNQKVVKPAMTRQTSIYFNTDNPSFPDECLKKEIVEYDYSIGPDSTYYNSYNCIEARTGVDSGIDNDFNSCEFKTVESFDFYPNQTNPWIINRLHKKTIVQSRTGKPDVIHSFWYEYTSNDSYQIKRLFDFPSLNNQDTLMVQTDFEYHEEGNLKKKTIRVPYGQQGEHARIVEYEYGPGEGSSNQRRLVTKETTRSGDLTYQTKYNYDLFDHLDTLIASNGLVTGFENDALGIVKTSTNPNGTHSGSALRWAEGYDYAPLGAMYFSWSRSSGNNKTLTFFHHTGAELRSVSFGLNGEAIFVDKEYDSKGRLWKVSNPYKDGDAVLYTEYQYDNQDRLTSTVTPDGTTTRIEYLGNQTKTTVSANGSQPHKSTITVNAMGWTVRSDDASGNSYVTYDHYADGLLASATVNNDPTTTVSATYDNARNRSTLTDPNYGTLTTVYNAYGELCQRVSPKELDAQTETTYLYDGLGRLVRETDGLENTTTHYIFDEEEGATKGLLKDIHHRTVGGQAIQYISYNYDDFARLIMTKDQRSSGIYTTSMEYDDYSRIKQTTYPTGVSIRNKYENGYLKSIIDANDHVLWKADGINAYGQLTDATLGNGVTTHRAYDPEMHYIDSIVTSNNLQNLSYGYDKFGNLASRKDNLRNLEESFHYDDMNRLTDIYLGNTHSQIVYDPLGRMTSKQADGQTVFANAGFAPAAGLPARPHAMKSAETVPNVFPAASQTVTYTGFDKVKTIAEGGNTLEYTYGYDQQRISMVETVGGSIRNKEYVGPCEYIDENNGGEKTSKTLTYLVGPYGVLAVVEQQDNEESLHYILKDHLGSWTTIIDDEGNVEQELSFDAWGNLRNPATWSGSYSGTPMFGRGYTGHEHIPDFGLINMNGRCYDPLTSSFLTVDAYVQDPTCAQAFNRYAYCAHNPLRYTDPTGWYQQSGSYGINPNLNTGGHTMYHSDDPNDMLWGRTSHPWANSSSGYVNGTAVTSTGYAQGNTTTNGYGGVGGWVRNKKTGAIYYDETATKATNGFLDITCVNGEDYYGLLGDHYSLNTEEGRFWKDVYDAIIAYVNDSREDGNELIFSSVDFSDVARWIPIDNWFSPNQNVHIYENNNPNLKLKNVLGIYSPCDVHLNGNERSMRASFGSWSTAYPDYGKPHYEDKPISLPKSFGQLPKGYPLCFSHEGNARAYVHFLNRESREYTKQRYCWIFGYTYKPNRP